MLKSWQLLHIAEINAKRMHVCAGINCNFTLSSLAHCALRLSIPFLRYYSTYYIICIVCFAISLVHTNQNAGRSQLIRHGQCRKEMIYRGIHRNENVDGTALPKVSILAICKIECEISGRDWPGQFWSRECFLHLWVSAWEESHCVVDQWGTDCGIVVGCSSLWAFPRHPPAQRESDHGSN